MEHTECAPPRRKDLTNSLERKIKHLEKQRQELLDVNQQWDQQFRNMKELYERKVLELKTKLAATENTHTLVKEQKQSVTEGDRQLEKEKDSLRKELQALKKENKLLKENNALANRKKEHYACEIKRLNKVPEQVKQGESTRKPQQEVVNHHRARATVRFLLLLLRMLSPVYTEHLATAYKPYLVRTL